PDVAALAVLVLDLLHVGAVGLAVLAPVLAGVGVVLPVVVQPLAGGHGTGGLLGQVNPGGLAEAPVQGHLLHLLHRGLGAGDHVGAGVVGLPHVVAEVVVHGVARLDQRLGVRHLALVGLAVVLVLVAADGDRRGAVVRLVQPGPVGHAGRGRGHLPGGTGSVLALGGVVDGGRTVGGAEQLAELGLGDAVGPHAGVVVGVAGHGHDLGLGRHHDRRALIGVVAGRAGLPDRRGQRALRVGLDLRVQAGHQVVTGLGRGGGHGAGDVAGRVDRHRVGAGLAGEGLVVLLLQARLPDLVRGGVADPGGQVVLLQLLGGGGLQVADHLGRIGAVGELIGDHALGLGTDPGELILFFHDLQRDLLA